MLRGFADDEPFLASADAHFRAVPWSPSLERALPEHGASPAAALSAVHDDLGRGGRTLRGAFWRTISDRFADAYYRRQHDWMRDHGVSFISNPLWDEYGPAEQIKSTGNLNTLNQWAQIPGTDLVFDHFQRGYHRTLPRWAASSAHQLGLPRVYNESMGAMGWGVTPALTREVTGGFAARGVNFTLLHAVYTDPGFIPYPPPFQPLNPWWNVSRPLNEWMGRVMEAGRAEARAATALLQPQRAAEAWQDTPRADAIDAAFTGAVHGLEDHQVDFDLVDEGALDGDPALRLHAAAQGGELRVGEQAYRVAVLPETPTLSLGAARTLTRSCAAAARWSWSGRRPPRRRAAATRRSPTRSASCSPSPAPGASCAPTTAGGRRRRGAGRRRRGDASPPPSPSCACCASSAAASRLPRRQRARRGASARPRRSRPPARRAAGTPTPARSSACTRGAPRARTATRPRSRSSSARTRRR